MDASRDKPGQRRDDGDTVGKFSAVELSMRNLKNRIFDLEFLETIVRETVARLGARKKEVAEEIRRLYERWESRENFCEEIQRFAAECDLCSLFNRYLDRPKRVPRERVAFDENRHPDVVEARTEVAELRNQLRGKNATRRCLEERVMQAKIQLQIARSYRENDAEIICLKNSVAEYEERYFAIESKIATMELADWQQLPATPVEAARRNFVTATELIAREEINDTIKRSRFSVKRESAISRKLADARDSRRRD